MRIAAIVLSTCLLGGCGATSLARIQSTYHDLMQQSEAVRKGEMPVGNAASIADPKKTDQAVATQMADLERAFLTLAEEAQESAGKASDPRTRVALLRTAGLAAWQAGDQGMEEVVRIQSLGASACAALAANAERFGAPRDCAILAGIGSLATSSQVGRQIAALEKRRSGAHLPQDAAAALEKAVSQGSAASARLWEVSERNKTDAGVEASVNRYFDHQRYLAYCNQLRLLRMAEYLPQEYSRKDDTVKVARKAYCDARTRVPADALKDACPGDARPADEKC